MNPLLQTLKIIDSLMATGATASQLQALHGVSPATLKRCIAEGRHLGADVVSTREGPSWVYTVRNPGQISNILARWIDLEEKRDLRGGV